MDKLSILEKIFGCGIVVGIFCLVISAVLVFVATFSGHLNKTKLSNYLSDATLKIALFTTTVGQIVFFFTAAGFFIYYAFDAIKNGEYNLAFSRNGTMKSNINWSNRPIRFAVQTMLFIGLSGYFQYVVIKTLRDIFKKNQT